MDPYDGLRSELPSREDTETIARDEEARLARRMDELSEGMIGDLEDIQSLAPLYFVIRDDLIETETAIYKDNLPTWLQGDSKYEHVFRGVDFSHIVIDRRGRLFLGTQKIKKIERFWSSEVKYEEGRLKIVQITAEGAVRIMIDTARSRHEDPDKAASHLCNLRGWMESRIMEAAGTKEGLDEIIKRAESCSI